MTARWRRRDDDRPVAPSVPGMQGVPADPADQPMGKGPTAAFRRWQQQRQLRRTERLERRITARENLRDFKRSTGDEPGPPGGAF
jgi:hypothetical protein